MNKYIFLALSLLIVSNISAQEKIAKPKYVRPIVLSELDRFPTKDVCQTMMSFNRKHQKYLNQILDFQTVNYPYFKEWSNENKRIFKIWDTLDSAWCWAYTYGNIEYDSAEWYLEELKRLIGEDNYNKGIMPPPVPIKYFKVIK